MTQISDVRKESALRGFKRTIKIGAVVADGMVQYNKNHAKLRDGIRRYGAFNSFTIINRDVVDVEVQLDFVEDKSYPVQANSSMSVDEVTFQEFNLINLSAGTAITANKISMYVIYEPPLIRERISKKEFRRT